MGEACRGRAEEGRGRGGGEGGGGSDVGGRERKKAATGVKTTG